MLPSPSQTCRPAPLAPPRPFPPQSGEYSTAAGTLSFLIPQQAQRRGPEARIVDAVIEWRSLKK